MHNDRYNMIEKVEKRKSNRRIKIFLYNDFLHMMGTEMFVTNNQITNNSKNYILKSLLNLIK